MMIEMKPDPSKPLANSRHEAFAVAWAKGGTATDAARVAGYSVARARFTGRDIATNRHVLARVAWLKSRTATAEVLTMTEKRLFLARVVRSRLEQVPEDSDLWQEKTVTEDSVKRKLPDKLRAIALDNDLAGDGSEAGAADALVELMKEVASRA